MPDFANKIAVESGVRSTWASKISCTRSGSRIGRPVRFQAAIWARDLNGTYQFANESFRRMFDLPPGELAGRIATELLPTSVVSSFDHYDRQVMETRRSASFVEAIQRPGGARHLLMVKFPLIDEHNRVIAIGGTGIDITEQIRLQEELRRLNATLEQRVENRTRELRETRDGLLGLAWRDHHQIRKLVHHDDDVRQPVRKIRRVDLDLPDR